MLCVQGPLPVLTRVWRPRSNYTPTSDKYSSFLGFFLIQSEHICTIQTRPVRKCILGRVSILVWLNNFGLKTRSIGFKYDSHTKRLITKHPNTKYPNTKRPITKHPNH